MRTKQAEALINRQNLSNGKWKICCAVLALLYTGDTIATYSGPSSYSDDVEGSRSASRSGSLSQDIGENVNESLIEEMQWTEYRDLRHVKKSWKKIVITDYHLALNDFRYLGEERLFFPNLEELVIIGDCDKKTLSILLSKTPNLEHLQIAESKSKQIPESIGQVQSLKRLYLDSDISIYAVPDKVLALPKLELLQIKDQKYTKEEIAEEIAKRKSARYSENESELFSRLMSWIKADSIEKIKEILNAPLGTSATVKFIADMRNVRGHSKELSRKNFEKMVKRHQIAINPSAEIINMKDKDGNTPLIYALKIGKNKANLNVIKCIVEHGADINAKDEEFKTPLHYAVLCKREDIIEYLLKHGADINAKAKNKSTPISIALGYNNRYEVLNKMLGYNSNVEEEGKKYIIDSVNLSYAVSHNLKNLSKYLLDHKEDIVNTQDGYKNTPLHYAVEQGLLDMVKILLEHNADTGILNQKRETPLTLAIKKWQILSDSRNTYEEIIETMKADINIQDKSGNTLLHYLASSGHPKTINLVLKYGADVKISNKTGETPLDLALNKLSRLENNPSVDNDKKLERFKQTVKILETAQKNSE